MTFEQFLRAYRNSNTPNREKKPNQEIQDKAERKRLRRALKRKGVDLKYTEKLSIQHLKDILEGNEPYACTECDAQHNDDPYCVNCGGHCKPWSELNK